MRRTTHLPLLLLVCAGSCTLPPLRGELEVGKDAYAVFVGEGSGGTDLFAIRANGGVPIALTFSPVSESAPALSPDGGMLAFLRTGGSGGQDAARSRAPPRPCAALPLHRR